MSCVVRPDSSYPESRQGFHHWRNMIYRRWNEIDALDDVGYLKLTETCERPGTNVTFRLSTGQTGAGFHLWVLVSLETNSSFYFCVSRLFLGLYGGWCARLQGACLKREQQAYCARFVTVIYLTFLREKKSRLHLHF